jgi:hypothetical protein
MNQSLDQQLAKRNRRVRNVILIAGLAIGVGFCGHVISKIQQAREAAREASCRGRFCSLTLALYNYESKYGSLPPAYVADAEGKPMHSWRVLILPFIDGVETYNQYRFDEPWDGPHNSQLAKNYPNNCFRCPSGPDPDHSIFTNYVVIVGPDTAFPGNTATKFNQFQDGIENTILIAEINNSNIHWMEPRDLTAERMSFRINDPKQPSISSPHPRGPGVSFGGSCSGFRLNPSIPPETIKAMTTIAGHEPVIRDKLVRSDPATSVHIP